VKNEIYLGDCLELSKSIQDESIDLIIADPPYNVGKDFGNNKDKWDSPTLWFEWCKPWLQECKRILKPTGSIFIYSIHHYVGFLQTYCYDLELVYGRMIIWHYLNGWSRYTKAPASTYEPILWFTKTKNYTYIPIREPYKSTERLKNKITKNGKVWTPNPEGKLGGDIWSIPTLAGARFANEKVAHPTQKPLALCNKIIQHFSNEGDLIFVPFVGSGSECVSAQSNNRDFLGFEINPEYVEIANKRINTEKQHIK